MQFSFGYENEIKYRNEIKYLGSEGILRIVEARISALCIPDAHGGPDGNYTVRSLYFDTPRNTCLHDSENGIDPRFKYRIRMYNGNKDYIVLEQKCKKHGMNHKRVCRINELFCEKLLQSEFDPEAIPAKWRPPSSRESSLLMNFYADYQLNLYRPITIVDYDRTAYLYETGNVRITLDRFISASGSVTEFLAETIPLSPVMPPGMHILEVKYDDFLPDHLYHALGQTGCIRTAFSKYYYSRQFCG